jgi:hypothetical protein
MRFPRAVALAAITHAAVVVALAALPPRPHRAWGVARHARETEIALDEESDLQVGSVAADEGAPTPDRAEVLQPASMRASSVAPGSAAVAASGDAVEAPALAPADGEGRSSSVVVVPPGLEGLGIGRTNPLLGAFVSRDAGAGDGESERQAEAKQRVLAALNAPLDAKDRDLGLGPDGPVLAALGRAVSESRSPVKGKAVFLARVDEHGHVFAVEVADSNSPRSEWEEAARLAATALAKEKVRLRPGARGAELRIEVSSAWKLPSGHDPGVNVTVAGIPVAKGEGKDSSQVRVLDVLPKLEPVELVPGTKIMIPTVTFTLLAGSFDASNIGATARRVMHTRLVGSTYR